MPTDFFFFLECKLKKKGLAIVFMVSSFKSLVNKLIIMCGETNPVRCCWRSGCCVVTGNQFPSCATDIGLVKRSWVAMFHREYWRLILLTSLPSFTHTTTTLCMAAAPPAVSGAVLQCTPVLCCPPRVLHHVAVKGPAFCRIPFQRSGMKNKRLRQLHWSRDNRQNMGPLKKK